MRDAVLIGGDISLATKDTLATGANTLQMAGTHHSKYGKGSTDRTGDAQPILFAVFQAAAALASGDYFYGVVSHCDAVGGTYTPCAQTPNSAAACAAGTIVRCPIPTDHLAFLRLDAMPKSSGTFTAKTVTAWLEYGPNV